MIEIQALSKTYRGNIQALRDINLTIGRGMFGLIGKNGAGKTTLMRLLTGLLRPTQGSITIFGNNLNMIRGKQAARALIGYLPQELGLYPMLNAYEFLDYMAVLKGIGDAAIRRREVARVLEQVHLTRDASRQLKTYSGGMKRRIGIAQALLGSPRVLVVDEPTAGLDPEERVRFRNLLSEIALNAIVILSTHIVEDIGHSCNDLGVINLGQVIYRGSPADLIKRTRGHVWTLLTYEKPPESNMVIVSTQQLQNGIQYRVIGESVIGYNAQPVEPSLEDSYLWLMRASTLNRE
jgi:ABC-2 type transport system ATP-binding protein